MPEHYTRRVLLDDGTVKEVTIARKSEQEGGREARIAALKALEPKKVEPVSRTVDVPAMTDDESSKGGKKK